MSLSTSRLKSIQFRKNLVTLLIFIFGISSCDIKRAKIKSVVGPESFCPNDDQLGYFKKSGRPLDSFKSCYQEDINQLIKSNSLLGYARWMEYKGKDSEAEQALLEASILADDSKKYLMQLGKLKLSNGLWDEAAYYFDLAGMKVDDQLWINTVVRSKSYNHTAKKSLIPYIFTDAGAKLPHRSEVNTDTNSNFAMVRVDQADPGVLAGETSIVTSNDGENIWIVWTDSSGSYDSAFMSNSWKLRAARSTDGGETWINDEFSIVPEFDVTFHFDPMTAYDPVNEIFYAGGIIKDLLGSQGSFYVKKWHLDKSAPENVSRTFGFFDKFLMTVNNGKLYMVEGLFQNYYNVSDDFGSTFSRIDWPESLGGFESPLPKFDNFGCFYIVDHRNFLKCGDDGFEKIVAPNTSLGIENMGNYLTGTFRSIPHRLIDFHPVDNRIIMIYPELESSESSNIAIWMTQSLDGGETWQEPWIITPEVTGDRFLPWLKVDAQGGIHISYADSRNYESGELDTQAYIDMYYSYSGDMGQTWQETRITPKPLKVPSLEAWGSYFFSDYLEMGVANSGDVFIAFPWFEGVDDMDMYVAKKQSIDTGFSINQGVSGAWFNPETAGSGLFLDLRPEDNFAFAGWFTHDFDDESRPEEDNGTRWYTASGNYSQNSMEMTLYETSGGIFDNPQDVNTIAVGELNINFSGCNDATVIYKFIDGSGLEGDFPVTRAIPGTGDLCAEISSSNGKSWVSNDQEGFSINQGVSAAWLNPETSGSGFFFDLRPEDNFAFAGWFTHDLDDVSRPEGDNGTRWYTASGVYNQDSMELTLYETSGGLFDSPQDVITLPVGDINILFEDCGNAIVNYMFNDDSGLAGSFPMKRAVPHNEGLCSSL